MGGGAVAGDRHVEHVLGERPDVVLKGRDALLEKSTDRLGDVVVGRVALAERREDGKGLLDDDEHGLGDRVAWDNTLHTFVTLDLSKLTCRVPELRRLALWLVVLSALDVQRREQHRQQLEQEDDPRLGLLGVARQLNNKH